MIDAGLYDRGSPGRRRGIPCEGRKRAKHTNNARLRRCESVSAGNIRAGKGILQWFLCIRCQRPTTRVGEMCIQWSFADPLPKANYSRWRNVHPMVFCGSVAEGQLLALGKSSIRWSFVHSLPKGNYSRWGRVHPMVFCGSVAEGQLLALGKSASNGLLRISCQGQLFAKTAFANRYAAFRALKPCFDQPAGFSGLSADKEHACPKI